MPTPSQPISLSEPDVAKAASEFLKSSSERRKRGRPPSTSVEPQRKRHDPPQVRKVNVELARKSAIALSRESPSYKKLIDVEERLDLAIMRKQQDIKEALKSQSYSESRTFRLYLFNTYRSQPKEKGVTDQDIPSWSLRIQGHLLPKADTRPEGSQSGAHQTPQSQGVPLVTTSGIPTAQPGTTMPASPSLATTALPTQNANTQGMNPINATEAPSILTGPPPKCSDVFKRIVIELDKELYPENNLIEWKRNDGDPSSDGFEISRAGSKEFTAKVFLYVDHKPGQFRLSHSLARLIGTKTDTKTGVFSGVWQYVKKMGLQCVDDRTAVRLDAGLKSLFGPATQNVEVLKLQQLLAVVKTHMSPSEPLMIEYDVRLQGDVVDNQDCYDVQVTVQDTALLESARRAGVFGLSLPQSREYDALNEKHMMALQKIALHKKRRDFFHGFCSNPVQFINHLILSQTRDLKVLGGSTGRNPEDERRSAFYQQQWVHEAVPRYLLRKAIADTAEDTVESGLK